MKKGKLTLITGCMFSGKTTRVIAMAQEAVALNRNIEIYYPEIDTRYTKNYITSHDALQLPSKSLPIDTTSIVSDDKEVIFIDEIHFFKPEILHAIERLVDEGIDMIVSGLDKNFRGEGFGIVPDVMTMADEVITLEANCVVCQKPATFSQRVVGDHFASKEDKTIVIGGQDLYEARCRNCFIKP